MVHASGFILETIHGFLSTLFLLFLALWECLCTISLHLQPPLGVIIDTGRADRSMGRLILSDRRLFICFRNWADIGEYVFFEIDL